MPCNKTERGEIRREEKPEPRGANSGATMFTHHEDRPPVFLPRPAQDTDAVGQIARSERAETGLASISTDKS